MITILMEHVGLGLVKDTGMVSLLEVHECSGAERSLDGKDLASAYVLCPLNWQVLVFQSLGGVELRRSLGGVDNVVRDQDQRFKVRDGGGVGVGVGVITKVSKLREEK
jgi:hypothetical protein